MNWESLITPAVLFLLTMVIFPLVRGWLGMIRNEKVKDFGIRAMDFAEAEANRRFKTVGLKTASEDKKAMALDYALDLASAAKIRIAPETMSKVIEEAIGATKAK